MSNHFRANEDTFLDALVAPLVHESQSGRSSPDIKNKEDYVRVFIFQLVTALQYMHDRKIAHLDLRPEVILLQDNHLRIADFGENQHVEHGRITDEFRASPEFVAPEVIKGEHVGLFADLWSVGVLTFVLIAGVSPFLGENDEETLLNVAQGKFNLQCGRLSHVTNEAIDFIDRLLVMNPLRRMTASEALLHPWISNPALLDANLSSDCLREFKYRHKWLERRVFVQQAETENIQTFDSVPLTEFSEAHPTQHHISQIPEPIAVYDFLSIKDRPRLIEPTQRYGNRFSPDSNYSSVSPSSSGSSLNRLPYPLALTYFDEYQGLYQSESEESIPALTAEDYARAKLGAHLINSRDTSAKNTPSPFSIPSASLDSEGSPMINTERKQLKAQDRGECPSAAVQFKKELERKLVKAAEATVREEEFQLRESIPHPIPPIHLVRGEHRLIEEEIANRILSDISEENSIAGSMMSLDDIEPLPQNNLNSKKRTNKDGSMTPSDVSLCEDLSCTPLASPSLTLEIAGGGNESPKAFFKDKGFPIPSEQLDPAVPVGAPLFVEGLGQKLVLDLAEERPRSRGALSPNLRSRPGTKSPIMLSPGREHSMEVVISTKRGRQRMTKEKFDEADEDDSQNDPLKKQQKASSLLHDDDDFEALMAEAENIKAQYKENRPKDDTNKDTNKDLKKDSKNDIKLEVQPAVSIKITPDDSLNQKAMEKRKTFEEELEKYRPKNFFKEEEWERAKPDIDDCFYDSQYQIGPDTLLLASRGAGFNARVRDYRRELFGDAAPYVNQGYLGYRNRDISVRERRRYTDLIKEEPRKLDTTGVTEEYSKMLSNVHNSIANLPGHGEATILRTKEKDGDVVFKQRLRDTYWYAGKEKLAFEVQVLGSPTDVIWKYDNVVLQESDKIRIRNDKNVYKLEILKPEQFELGEYSCEARNKTSVDKTSCRAYIGIAPGQCGRPDVELASDTEVLITWTAPTMSTTLEGIFYKLEVRPASEKDYSSPWTVISDKIDGEVCLVKHLHPQGVYQFRVCGRSGNLWGVPSLNSRIIKTHRRGVPKLQAELLKRDVLITAVSVPNKPSRSKDKVGLSEIQEEEESGHETMEESVENSEDDHENTPTPEFGVNLVVGENVDKRFDIEREIFRGRYSVVYNTIDNKNEGRSLCIAKKRLSQAPDCPSAINEYENLKACQSINVVQLLAAYEKNDTLTLITEKLYEDVFHRFCSLENYNEEAIVLTIRQIVSVLHWIHYKGILHLDVNPENVMFVNKRSWFVKLIDFGNSQRIEDGKIKPTVHQRIDWKAPEVIKGDVLTEKTDMWGMGLIAFTILSGFHPFSSKNDKPDEIQEAIINVKCDPNLIPVQATQEALRFATWATKKDPRRRMSTQEALEDRWLASDSSIVRRREAVNYSSSRLRKTADYTMRRVPQLNGTDMTPSKLLEKA
uniref:Protein kinase domain-containing protein n=1 Tax=Rhabditophanes sp. KR3021 TaxID=114890 RepID=A0AC35UCB8_9BILA